MRSKQPDVVTTNADDVLWVMCEVLLYSRSTSKRDGHARQAGERTYFLWLPVCHCHDPPTGLQSGRGSQDGGGDLGETEKRRRSRERTTLILCIYMYIYTFFFSPQRNARNNQHRLKHD